MATASALLPPASTRLERAYADATDLNALLDDGIQAIRGAKYGSPPPSFLPYLVYEYGLGELTPYVENLYELIREGIQWQRVRGTPRAVEMALGWIGYAATLHEFPTWRRHWNYFQLELDRVRDAEEPDFFRIEGIAGLSVPIRSVFWRGFREYDVRAQEYGHSRWSRSMWSSYSGVRIPSGQAKWSFGRTYDYDHTLTQQELEDLGVWIEPTEDEKLTWGNFPWPEVPWADPDGIARSVVMRSNAPAGPAWVVFKDDNGDVIGYRRALARRPVKLAVNGVYRIGGSQYSPATGATMLYVEARTDFGDGYGAVAKSAGVILGAKPVAPYPIGARWVPAGGLDIDGPVLAERPVDIEFGRTVRERVRTLLRF